MAERASPFERILGAVKSGTDLYYGIKDHSRKSSEHEEESDPNSALSKMVRGLANQSGMQLDDSVSASQAKRGGLIEFVKAAAEAQRYRDTLAAQRGAREDAKNERTEAREERRREREDRNNEKKEEKEQALAVPGYDRTGEVMPKAEEAAKFRKATAQAATLSNKLNRMKELVKKYGSFEWGGDGGTEMESLATEIQLLSKSPEMYELGVLTGPDLMLLNKIAADPGSWGSMFSKDSSRQTQIDAQLASIKDRLGTTAKSLGYASKLPGGATPPASPPGQGITSDANAGNNEKFSAKDLQALQWLQGNANDPRAPAIKAELKQKGLIR